MANTSLVNQLINDLKGSDEQKQRHALYRLGQLREPSALPALLEGRLLADSIAALGSMDFVLGDTDR